MSTHSAPITCPNCGVSHETGLACQVAGSGFDGGGGAGADGAAAGAAGAGGLSWANTQPPTASRQATTTATAILHGIVRAIDPRSFTFVPS